MSRNDVKQKWWGVSILRHVWKDFRRSLNECSETNSPNAVHPSRKERDNRMSDEFERWRKFLAENQEIRGTAIVIFDEQDRVLIVKRAKRSHWMPERWGLPGGRMEPGETPPEAVIRETKEEVNLDVRNIDELQIKSEHGIYFTTREYSGTVTLSDEHTDFAWASPDELSSYDTTPNLELRVRDAMNGKFV